MEEKTTIPVKKSTRNRLQHMGEKGDNYDFIVNNLLDLANSLGIRNGGELLDKLKEKEK